MEQFVLVLWSGYYEDGEYYVYGPFEKGEIEIKQIELTREYSREYYVEVKPLQSL